MKAGDNIGGYTLLRDFTTAGGGLSKWTFARKEDKDYFLKEFLLPTYPIEGSPGSEATLRKKRELCKRFETHHLKLQAAIAGKVNRGGNLVYMLDFFRHSTKYYKVTDKIDVAGLSLHDIAHLKIANRLLILKTVVHSLNILHSLSIVHADLKPDNVLIKETAMGGFTAKLIDFDSSYFSGNPLLLGEEIVGDMVYYSPELARFIKEPTANNAAALTPQSDIFSLGLLYCVYLTGQLPNLSETNNTYYLHELVMKGEPIRLPENCPPELAPLITRMLDVSPEARPTAAEVISYLQQVTIISEHALPELRKNIEPVRLPEQPPRPRLRGKGLSLLKNNLS